MYFGIQNIEERIFKVKKMRNGKERTLLVIYIPKEGCIYTHKNSTCIPIRLYTLMLAYLFKVLNRYTILNDFSKTQTINRDQKNILNPLFLHQYYIQPLNKCLVYLKSNN